jgi:hypothetical protein
LFELTDAVLCADGPVTSLVELSLTAEHRRGHGALYAAFNWGDMDIACQSPMLSSVSSPTRVDRSTSGM